MAKFYSSIPFLLKDFILVMFQGQVVVFLLHYSVKLMNLDVSFQTISLCVLSRCWAELLLKLIKDIAKGKMSSSWRFVSLCCHVKKQDKGKKCWYCIGPHTVLDCVNDWG